MNKETLEELEKALDAFPGNTILRKQIARGYFSLGDYTKAKIHLNLVLQQDPSRENKLLLAQCYLRLGDCSTGLLICEELLENGTDPDLAATYVQLLINDGQPGDAVAKYQEFMRKLPGWKDETLEMQLKIPSAENNFEAEEYNDFLEKPDVDFSKVGGMHNVKDEIRIKIIEPLKNPVLFKAFGKKAGGGILMYGPPGCGKTHLARATAGEIDSLFMSIDINDILDMWIGNSEKNLSQKFDVARKNKPCVVFFDEIDALGAKRNDLKNSGGRMVINQFLNELDGVNSDNEGLLILGATNSPWHMDHAFLRPGRFDRIIFVPPPDTEARVKIFEIMLEGKPVKNIEHQKLAEKSEGFSGADIKAVIDIAIEDKLRLSMKTGKIEELTTADLLSSLKKVKPSTKEWFNTARNYALYSNASGMYDDIKTYLKL